MAPFFVPVCSVCIVLHAGVWDEQTKFEAGFSGIKRDGRDAAADTAATFHDRVAGDSADCGKKPPARRAPAHPVPACLDFRFLALHGAMLPPAARAVHRTIVRGNRRRPSTGELNLSLYLGPSRVGLAAFEPGADPRPATYPSRARRACLLRSSHRLSHTEQPSTNTVQLGEADVGGVAARVRQRRPYPFDKEEYWWKRAVNLALAALSAARPRAPRPGAGRG